MKLYVCYGTFQLPLRPHVCGTAYDALLKAGHTPTVVKCRGLGVLPNAFNMSAGRRYIRKRTGNNWVPALELESGEIIQGSKKIIAWAQTNQV